MNVFICMNNHVGIISQLPDNSMEYNKTVFLFQITLKQT